MRFVDVMLSFPIILVALLTAAILPSGYLSLYFVTSLVLVFPATRVARAVFADIFARDFITAAVLRREAAVSVIAREALPNSTGPLFVEFAVRWNFAVILIASLSFLGVGVQPPTADWGLMLFEARTDLLIAPWIAIVPAVALAILTIAINFTADGLSAGFADRSDYHRQAK
jgi:peptide/nickel transport system permease protein